jgi:hypothetical protein
VSDPVVTRPACLGCDFAVFSDALDPEDLSRRIGVEADWSLPPVPAKRDRKGLVRERGRRGCWLLHSKDRVASGDVNEHLRHLLAILLPHREAILAASEAGVASFSVLWAGTDYPHHSGPTIAADCVAGVAELRAEIDITWRGGRPTTADPGAAANPDRRAE